MGKRLVDSGFTLVELMVVLAVAAIMQTLAAPGLLGFVNSVRQTSAVNTLFGSLIYARAEAIKRRARVVLCKSANGTSCTSSGGWQQGWIVFHDANNNAARDAGEALLSHTQAFPDTLRMTGNAPVANYVSYSQAGNAKYTSGAFQAGTLTICLPGANLADSRLIVISSTGRPRTAKTQEPCVS